jgi:hypothetical protein
MFRKLNGANLSGGRGAGKFLFLRERPGGLINFSQIEKPIASPSAALPQRPGKESGEGNPGEANILFSGGRRSSLLHHLVLSKYLMGSKSFEIGE